MAKIVPSRLARTALVVVALVLLAVVAGCSRSTENKGAGERGVKLVLDWVAEPEFGGFFAARDGGAFRKAGLGVEIMQGGPGVPVVQMVAAGQVDFGISGGDGMIIARSRGADVIPIFATYHTSPQAIMVHASRGANAMADVFSGGTLAIDPGAAFTAHLKKKFGFERATIVPYDGGVARFVADKDFAQQCFITSEPIAARRKGADPKVFLIADEGFTPYATVVITRKALWKENPAVVRAFVRAVREGWRAYLDDPGPTNAVMGKLNPSMDAETFSAAAAEQKRFIEGGGRKQLGEMTRERWEALGKQLAELGVIDKAPPVDDYLVSIDE